MDDYTDDFTRPGDGPGEGVYSDEENAAVAYLEKTFNLVEGEGTMKDNEFMVEAHVACFNLLAAHQADGAFQGVSKDALFEAAQKYATSLWIKFDRNKGFQGGAR